MRHIVKTEEDWLELRKKYITASEAAVLVGADPYSSPKKVREPSTFRGNAFTEVGHMLEPVVINVTNKVMGTTFELYENDEGWKEFYTEGHLGATPDAHMNRTILLEAKTTRPRTYVKYSSVPPSKYLIQLLVQMICTGTTEGYLAILSTDMTQQTATLHWPITIYKVLYNEEICNILKEESQRFIEDEKFRVNSKVKKRVNLLLTLAYERI